MVEQRVTPFPVAAENNDSPGVTRRVVLLCLALAVFFGYVIPVIDLRLSNTYLGAMHLPPGAIAALLVLLLVVNPLLRALARRWVFSRNELLTVYISCLFSCLVPGHGAENFFISNIIGPFYYATPYNKWLDWLRPHLQPWFTPALTQGGEYNRAVIEPWYTALREGESVPWGAWLLPLFAWGSLITASYAMLGFLAVLLRAQWGEREALSFPLLRLPLAMTEESESCGARVLAPFFRSPTMWCGFGVAAFIQLINGLNLYFPDVPKISLGFDTAPLLTESPWNQIGWTPLAIHPMAVGVAFILTTEVSFSLWAGFWLFKLQLVAAHLFGWTPAALPLASGFMGPPTKAFQMYQQVGAFLVYGAFILWIGRAHWKHILRRAFGRTASTREERREALSYPLAFWGFVFCFAFLIAWSVAAGMRADVALLMWLGYLAAMIVLTRVVVEGGLLFVLQGWTPMGTLAGLFGSGANGFLAPSSIVPGAMIQSAMMSDVRSFLMPSFLHAFKLAHDRKIAPRPLLALIGTVIFITFATGVWMNVSLGYRHGALQLDKWYQLGGAYTPAGNIEQLSSGFAKDTTNWLWLVFGGGATWLLMLLRARLSSFPLHPIGLLMGLTHPMHVVWMSVFLGWLCKATITRFGGVSAQRAATPFFLGLILGDVSTMLFWLVVDGFTGRVGHQLAL